MFNLNYVNHINYYRIISQRVASSKYKKEGIYGGGKRKEKEVGTI
ncbi:hypothetical protein [Oceanobacillus sp. FSL W7-1309]